MEPLIELDLDALRAKKYVRCDDYFPWGIRHIYRFFLAITGFLCLLSMMPLYAFVFFFIAPCYYYGQFYKGGICSKRNVVNNYVYFPSDSYKPSPVCHPCMTIFFGSCRLKLNQIPLRKRGLYWHIRNRIAGTYQIIEFVLNAAKAKISIVAYWNVLGKAYGNFFPVLFGIGVADNETITRLLHSSKTAKGLNIFSLPISDSSISFLTLSPIYVNTHTPDHITLRQLTHGFLMDFYNKYKNKQTLLDDLKRVFIYNSKASDDDLRRATVRSLFYVLTGYEMTRIQVNACCEFLTFYAATNTMPSWFHFLFFGYYFERRLLNIFETIRDAFIQNYQCKAMQDLLRMAKEKNFDVNEAIRSVAHVFIVGACVGIEPLLIEVIKKIRENPTLYVKQYSHNPMLFMRETVRLQSFPSAVTVISKEDMKLNIGGQEVTIVTGTPLLLMLQMYHFNPAIFNDPYKFDFQRKNLDLCLTFNGYERYLLDNKTREQTAPRYCPGHDLALFLGEFLIDRHMPYVEPSDVSLEQQKTMDNYEEKFDGNLKKYYHDLPIHTKIALAGVLATLKDGKDMFSLKRLSTPHDSPCKLKLSSFLCYTVPDTDEDFADGLEEYGQLFGSKVLSSKFFPVYDAPNEFKDTLEGLEMREKIFKDLMSAPNVLWKEFESDNAQSLFVFYGPGFAYLRPVNRECDPCCPDNAYWICDVTYLSLYKVRAGLESFGHCAYFDENRQILGIYWCEKRKYVTAFNGNKDGLKNIKSAEWEHVKWAWRCSVSFTIQLRDHLLICHWTEANALVKAVRETLPGDHYLRRLLKIFTFRTSFLNRSAIDLLVNNNGVFIHAFGLEYSELVKISNYINQGYKFQFLPDKFKEQGVTKDKLKDEECPVLYDSLDYWDIIYQFVQKYLLIYNDNSIQSVMDDEYINAFSRHIMTELGITNMDAISLSTKNYQRAFDSFVSIVTQLIVNVTGNHEFYGNFVEFNKNASGFSGKIRPNAVMGDVQAYIQVLTIGALTTLRTPPLINDFSKLILDDDKEGAAKNLLNEWQTSLLRLAEKITAKNTKTRLQPFNAYNPNFMECSVSV